MPPSSTDRAPCGACAILGRFVLASSPARARRCRRRTSPTSGASAPSPRTSPWRFSASRRSSVSVATSRLLSPRPGSRVLISWSSQLLPSGSLNVASVVYERPFGVRARHACVLRSRRNGTVSLTSAPRAMSSARAASMSDTTRYRFWTEPGAAVGDALAEVDRAGRAGRRHLHGAPVVRAGKSASSRHPRPS